MHKFVHEPGAPWYVPTELKRVDIPLASAGDVTNMAKTDRLSRIALFEPMEGRSSLRCAFPQPAIRKMAGKELFMSWTPRSEERREGQVFGRPSRFWGTQYH